jgi:outer membrane protein OmpA-like peptidoglycan-associated protein
MSLLLLLTVPSAFALDAHGFSFEGVTGDVEDYARQGYPTAGVFGDGDISLVLDYARDPLTEITPDGRVPVLSALGTATLSGAFSFGALRLEAGLPVHPIGTDSAGSFSALGDARLGVMVPIPWTSPDVPLMAIHTVVSFPTGSTEHFVSAGGFRFAGTVLAAKEFGPVGLVGTVGGVVSRPEEERNLKAGVGPILGIGTSYRLDERFSGALEFTGESEYGFSSFPVEATLSGRYRAPLGAWATAGAAAGLSSGVGSSRWRLFVGFGWSFREENHKNLEPVVAEADPTADRDGDGIFDVHDSCPDQKETVDGFEDDDGCPELDGDGDGVPFVRDQCPREAIRPEQDPRYSDGCPRIAELDGNRIVITETIFFKEGRADLLPASERVLSAVRDIMQQNPTLGPILIAGHTNSNGSDSFNMRLSDARAYAVMSWLVDHGIDPVRLISKGYGETQPLVPETDANAEAVNRRVEFQVLSGSDVATDFRQVELSAAALEARRKAASGQVDPPPPPPEPKTRSKKGRKTAEAPKPAEPAQATVAPSASPEPVKTSVAPIEPPKPAEPALAVPTTVAPSASPEPVKTSVAPVEPPKPVEPAPVPAEPSKSEPVKTEEPVKPPSEPAESAQPPVPVEPAAVPPEPTAAPAEPTPPPAEPAKPARSSGRRSSDSNDHH